MAVVVLTCTTAQILERVTRGSVYVQTPGFGTSVSNIPARATSHDLSRTVKHT